MEGFRLESNLAWFVLFTYLGLLFREQIVGKARGWCSSGEDNGGLD